MQDIRNIAIIAHVDHGKTTLVDKMMLAGNLFRENQNGGELVLDNNDLERERGITILSKNVSINYKGTKINIIDTPGLFDFAGGLSEGIRAAETALIVLASGAGVDVGTEKAFKAASKRNIAKVFVVTRCDDNSDFNATFSNHSSW